MTDDTLIADLIRAGVSPELVGRVANAIALSGTMSGTSAGAIREYHRNKKQVYRDKIRILQGKPEANDAGVSAAIAGDVSRTVPDSRTNDSFFLSSSESIQEERKKKEVVARARGTRITADWQPSADDRQFAIDHGVDVESLRAEFVDYWIAIPGQRGLKTNWPATWRNRVRQVGSRKASNGKRLGVMEQAADDLIARAEEQERTLDLGPGDYTDAGFEAGKGSRR